MNTCLSNSNLQGYLEESGPTALRTTAEQHMVVCAPCRAAFDRIVATHQRVNRWLAGLKSSAEDNTIDTRAALRYVLTRTPQSALPDPRAIASSFLLQAAAVALLMLLGTTQVGRTPTSNVTLLEPPPVRRTIPSKPARGSVGGGGQHSPLPPPKSVTPKSFTGPNPVAHPVLQLDASLLTQPSEWSAPTAAILSPLDGLRTGGGPGTKGGIGAGVGPGIGDDIGPGTGGNGADGGIFTVGKGITQPTLITRVDPEYSEEARKAKYSGSVLLSIVVSPEGRAEDIRVVRSLGMGLDEKAIAAVRQWRFKPGTNNGAPVRVRAQVDVTFRLL
jgi:TonB family protein